MGNGLCLDTARLILRPMRPEDRPDLVALDADPEVMRFLNGGQSVPEDGALEASFLTPRGHGAGVWVALELVSGRFVGWFSLRPGGEGGVAELGYRLRRDAWGRGYATEGSRALIAAGFARLGYERIWGETMAVNAASRRVMEKAGLRHVGTHVVDWPDPLPGSELGEVTYEITRQDGEAGRPS